MFEFLLGLVGLGALSLFTVSTGDYPPMHESQRDWVRRRDEHKCRMPKWNERTKKWTQCLKPDGGHVHHIFPKRAFVLWAKRDPHTTDNLIYLCVDCHNSVHPDMISAKTSWRKGDKKAYKDTFDQREVSIRTGKIYWDTSNDLLLKLTAEKRTKEYESTHPEDKFPSTESIMKALADKKAALAKAKVTTISIKKPPANVKGSNGIGSNGKAGANGHSNGTNGKSAVGLNGTNGHGKSSVPAKVKLKI